MFIHYLSNPRHRKLILFSHKIFHSYLHTSYGYHLCSNHLHLYYPFYHNNNRVSSGPGKPGKLGKIMKFFSSWKIMEISWNKSVNLELLTFIERITWKISAKEMKTLLSPLYTYYARVICCMKSPLTLRVSPSQYHMYSSYGYVPFLLRFTTPLTERESGKGEGISKKQLPWRSPSHMTQCSA